MSPPPVGPDQHCIAIVAMGGIFPSAPGPRELWERVCAAADGSRDVPPGRWLLDPAEALDPARGKDGPQTDRVTTLRGYFLQEVPESPADLDPAFRIALAAAGQAWQAGVTHTLARARVGVVLGHIALPTETTSALTRAVLGRTLAERALGREDDGFPELPSPENRCAPALAAGLVARALGLGGGSYTLDAACASSLYAIKLAADELLAGRADAMLAGGVSRPDCLYTQMGFSQLRALSPTGRCSPFDAAADGLVVGEGAGVFLLKRLEDALRDGDEILAVLAGAGLSNDADGGLLAPSSEGQLRAMRAAYRAAGWRPGDVDLIECHATGTPVGDVTELRSLQTLWEGEARPPGGCVLGSVKSTVGHLLTAAGAAGLAKILGAFRNETLPPTANFTSPPPGVPLAGSPFRILRRPEPWPRRREGVPRRAAVSAFGFGGINAHLLLEEWLPARKPTITVSFLPEGKTLSSPPVAVVGLAAHVGPWPTLRAFQRRVLGGDPAATPAPIRNGWGVEESAWFAARFPERFPGFYLDAVSVEPARFRVPPRELEEMLPQQLLLLNIAAALWPAGVAEEKRLRTGAFVGVGLDLNTTNFHLRWGLPGDVRTWAGRLGLTPEEAEAWLDQLREAAGPALNANRVMGALASIAASRVARTFRLGGPSFTLSGEEASGLRALEVAVRALQEGELDQALVGAVDLTGDVRSVLLRFAGVSDVPPVGDGAVGLVLKRLDDAARDGDTVYAVLSGLGAATGPTADRLARSRAHAEAGFEPDAVGHLAFQATPRAEGSFEGDVGELQRQVGHLGAAGGLAAVVKACLCLHHQILPTTAGPRPWLRNRVAESRRAAVHCQAEDGNRVHILLEEGEPARVGPPWGPRPEALFAVEGADVEELLAKLGRLSRLVEAADPAAPVEALARQWFRESPPRPVSPLGLALVANGHGSLRQLIETAREHLETKPDMELPSSSDAARDRIFYSPRPLGNGGHVAFVFPGSGNDFPGMGSTLALHWPEVLRRQDAENEYLRSQYIPEAFWEEAPARAATMREKILGQVALTTLVADVFAGLGVRPRAAVGYSLGESAALFALRAWPDRDMMLRAMNASTLFSLDLAGGPGGCRAAARAWGLAPGEPVDWVAAVVDRAPAAVRAACAGLPRAYLLIINTPAECIVGGQRDAVREVVRRLGCPFLPVPETTTVHCPVVREVAEAYRALHRLPVDPRVESSGVRFYSTALGRAYELTSDSAAEAILAQALDTVDFPGVIEAAYRNGVRVFLEMGPGASCTRMIGSILAGRPHRARSACVPGINEVSSVLRALGQLIAERLPVDLHALYGVNEPEESAGESKGWSITVPVGGRPFNVPPLPRREGEMESDTPLIRNADPAEGQTTPPVAHPEPERRMWPPLADAATPFASSGRATAILPQVAGAVRAEEARGQAHAAYLGLTRAVEETLHGAIAFQTGLLEAGLAACGLAPSPPSPRRGDVALDRDECLEFARGSIGRVLGPAFAAVDAHPTRVRLPDEPLMLVDRILTIEGEAGSLGPGRVVTEHDVLHDGWYLDNGRIPTCIAIEAGQADLFLSAYLGIDARTRGRAVYRLLDAAVTFHGPLPRPGEVIRYDIHIDHFFRQGDTYLFRFRFDGTVHGEPLLSMRDGCAGFFTAEELARGKGIVLTELARRPMAGVEPDNRHLFPPMKVESFDDRQVDALRAGDLAGCFGLDFDHLPLANPCRLPGGRMRLVHRVTHLDPRGGRFGIGLIRAEADVHPDDWFLTCHFVDDQVMPGTLMYECCLHTFRIFLMRLGWVGEHETVCWEPVPGVASRLRCRGQVTADTRTVTYEVAVKERGYRPEPYALADAFMYADGKLIVEITDMSVRLSGLTREAVAAVWARKPDPPSPLVAGPGQILAFAVGKPSEAFGEPYRPFDRGRFVARLPGPPYSFLGRVVECTAEPFVMKAGGEARAQYDVPPDAWYFQANRQQVMPFAVLQEVALQACGWMAAYVGSALAAPTPLHFRNLGGKAELLAPVGPDAGTLETRAKMTSVSHTAGMIIQHYTFAVTCRGRDVYRGTTYFGFFSPEALADQVGLRDDRLYEPAPHERARSFPFPTAAPFPDERLRMIDTVDWCLTEGGPHGLGAIRGSKAVNPEEWFFKAHFYQDPVWPGSLGLEALVQLLGAFACERWPVLRDPRTRFLPMIGKHEWVYRGQVVPGHGRVEVEAVLTSVEEGAGDRPFRLKADGLLAVDGRVIYRMNGFTLFASPPGARA
jgi:acyl transferase domain-containing protein/3-hydroxymyristoyl/3-hydroxydecanoyl-(acyl carrier protein) dehydratase